MADAITNHTLKRLLGEKAYQKLMAEIERAIEITRAQLKKDALVKALVKQKVQIAPETDNDTILTKDSKAFTMSEVGQSEGEEEGPLPEFDAKAQEEDIKKLLGK